MQIDRRMDLDQHVVRDHHPVKPSSSSSSSFDENNLKELAAANAVNGKAKGGRGRVAKGRKRAFGQDLTNQHHEFCSQQNSSDNQLASKQPMLRSKAHSDFGVVVKPQVVVVDEYKPQSKKRKLTSDEGRASSASATGGADCGGGVKTGDDEKVVDAAHVNLDDCDGDKVHDDEVDIDDDDDDDDDVVDAQAEEELEDEDDDDDDDEDEDDEDDDEEEEDDEDDEDEAAAKKKSKKKSSQIKEKKKSEKQNLENDLELILSGRVDEYVQQKIPLSKDVKQSGAPVHSHSLSIQINEAQMNELKHEESDDEEKHEVEETPQDNDAQEMAKSRNRKLDRILRGSKSNLDYTKKVLGMVETDRNTPRADNVGEMDVDGRMTTAVGAAQPKSKSKSKKDSAIDSKRKKRSSRKMKTDELAKASVASPDNKYKQHLDDMIGNILAGKEFVPFPADEDRARYSNEEDDDDDDDDGGNIELPPPPPPEDETPVAVNSGAGVTATATANATIAAQNGDDKEELDVIDIEMKAMEHGAQQSLPFEEDEDVDEMFENTDINLNMNANMNANVVGGASHDMMMNAVVAQANANLHRDNIENEHDNQRDTPSIEHLQFQSLIKTAIGPSAMDSKNGGHHKRQSTRLLLDSLRPSTSYGFTASPDDMQMAEYASDEEMIAGGGVDGNGLDVSSPLNKQHANSGGIGSGNDAGSKSGVTRHITWGMILIELDNFDRLLKSTGFERDELIAIIQELIDGSLEYQNQYVDHMTQGQFVLLTPVDIIITRTEIESIENKLRNAGTTASVMANLNVADDEYFYEKKEDRLRDIAASVLQHLSQEEEGLEFCMGVALQDRVSSDQEWFEIARESLEEMKAYREMDRQRRVNGKSPVDMDPQQQPQNGGNLMMGGAQAPMSSMMTMPLNMASGISPRDSDNGVNDPLIAERLKRRSTMRHNLHKQQQQGGGSGSGGGNSGMSTVFNAISMISDLDFQDENGNTALIIACSERKPSAQKLGVGVGTGGAVAEDADDNINVVLTILDNGCNVNLRNKEGMTAIMFAAMNGDTVVVRKLCELHANLEIKGITSKMTRTALLFAAEQGHKEVVATLLAFGANVNALCDEDDSNILHLCVNNNHMETVTYALQYNEEQDNILDINAQNKYGYTALMIAAYNGNERVLKLLIKFGADTQIKNRSNETAYNIARKANHLQLCSILLSSAPL